MAMDVSGLHSHHKCPDGLVSQQNWQGFQIALEEGEEHRGRQSMGKHSCIFSHGKAGMGLLDASFIVKIPLPSGMKRALQKL